MTFIQNNTWWTVIVSFLCTVHAIAFKALTWVLRSSCTTPSSTEAMLSPSGATKKEGTLHTMVLLFSQIVHTEE
jgi:hypothetical protein